MGKGYAESGKRQSSGCISERGKTVYSYQEFFEKADEFARILFYRYQVEPGMRVGLLMHNDMEFLISACALSRLRAAIVLCPAECGREPSAGTAGVRYPPAGCGVRHLCGRTPTSVAKMLKPTKRWL